MTGPIVIGLDGSERARDALGLGRVLAQTAGAGVVLTHVHALDPMLGTPELAGLGDALQADSASMLRAAESLLTGVAPVQGRALARSSPARGLQEIAEEFEASAIVVGSTHRGPIGRLLPGSVGERLLHGATCPVAVAPQGFWDRAVERLERIGVAYLDTPEAHMAAEAAAALAGKAGATLVVLRAMLPSLVIAQEIAGGAYAGMALGYDPATYAEVDAAARAQARTEIDELLASLPADLPAEARLLEGEPGHELAVASEDLDLLVCGSRGYGPLHSVLVGGVSGHLLRTAACPIVVTPRGTLARLSAGTAAAAPPATALPR